MRTVAILALIGFSFGCSHGPHYSACGYEVTDLTTGNKYTASDYLSGHGGTSFYNAKGEHSYTLTNFKVLKAKCKD